MYVLGFAWNAGDEIDKIKFVKDLKCEDRKPCIPELEKRKI